MGLLWSLPRSGILWHMHCCHEDHFGGSILCSKHSNEAAHCTASTSHQRLLQAKPQPCSTPVTNTRGALPVQAAGTLFAWSLQRTMATEQGYAPMSTQAEPTFSVDDPFASTNYAPRPPAAPAQGTGSQMYVPPAQPAAAPNGNSLV